MNRINSVRRRSEIVNIWRAFFMALGQADLWVVKFACFLHEAQYCSCSKKIVKLNLFVMCLFSCFLCSLFRFYYYQQITYQWQYCVLWSYNNFWSFYTHTIMTWNPQCMSRVWTNLPSVPTFHYPHHYHPHTPAGTGVSSSHNLRLKVSFCPEGKVGLDITVQSVIRKWLQWTMC